MAVSKDDYQHALEAAHRLDQEQRQKLIEELSRELREIVTPLALIGTWPGVSLSAQEIDEAREECWAGLGKDL
jgi:hypothetical protein